MFRFSSEEPTPDGEMTYADLGRAQQRRDAMQRKLCAALGLDPAETYSIRIDVESGASKGVVRWDGVRQIPVDELGKILGGVIFEPEPMRHHYPGPHDDCETTHPHVHVGTEGLGTGRGRDFE